MKNKKRISLILIFAMVLQLFSFSFASAQETEEIVKVPVATEEYNFFKTLGMLNPVEDLYAGEAITRAQFGYITARLIGYDGVSEKDAHFVDVDAESPYANAINYLYDMGVVRGTGDGKYQPEQPITFNDASAIIVKILEYDKIASAKYGAYPICNIRMADALDIYLDIKMPQGTASITTEEALIMFKNAVYAPIATMTVFGDEASTYTYDPTKTLLYVYHDIIRDEGVVTDDGITSVSGTTALKNGGAVIGNIKLNPSSNGFKVTGLLGAFVDYYYVEGTRELVYAEVNVDSTNTLTITFDDLVINSPEFSLTNIVYYETEDRIKDARIAMAADFIYNGGIFNSYTLDDLKIDSGYITLIDRNEDKIFDVVNVTEYVDYMVKGLNTTENTIYAGSRTIELNDYQVSMIVNHKNEEIKIGDIAANNLISVAASKDNTNITIIYANAPSAGVITKAETTENIYYMGDRAFKFSKALDASDYPEIGGNYNLYINADGYVAYVEELDSTDWYKGYLIGVGSESGSALDTTAIAGIIGNDGQMVKYYVADKIILNGNKITSAKLPQDPAVYDNEAQLPIRQPVKYKLDDWGDLMEMETPVDHVMKDAKNNPVKNPDYPLYMDLDNFSRDRYYTTAKWKGDEINSIDGIYFAVGSTLVVKDPYLDNPNAAFEFEEVEIVPANDYKLFKNISKAYLYDIDETNIVGCVVAKDATASEDSGSWSRALFIVESIYRALDVDKDGNKQEVRVVKGAASGKEVTYNENLELFKLPAELQNGDICLVAVGNNNDITDLQIIVRAGKYIPNSNGELVEQPLLGSKTYYHYDESENFVNNQIDIYSGPVYSLTKTGIVTIGWDPAFELLGTSFNTMHGRAMAIYDRETGKLTYATSKAIYTNVVPDEKGNYTYDDLTPRVVIYRRYDYVVDIVMIK